MFRNLSFRALGVALLCVSCQNPRAIAINMRESFVDETIQVEVTGSGATPESARDDAIQRALLKAVGTFIRSDATVEDGALVRDQLISHTQGLIEGYELLAQASKEGGLYEERARVTVRRTKLAGMLNDLAKTDGTIDGLTLSARLDELRRQRASSSELVELLFANWPANVLSISIGALPTEARVPGRAYVGRTIDVKEQEVYLEAKIDLRVDSAKWKTWAASARQIFEGIAVAKVDMPRGAKLKAERLVPGRADGYSGAFAQSWGGRLSPEAGAGTFEIFTNPELSTDDVDDLFKAMRDATSSKASKDPKPTFGVNPEADPRWSSVLVGIDEDSYYLVPCSALSRVHHQAPVNNPPLLVAELTATDGTPIPARFENVTEIWNAPFMAAQGNTGCMWASPARLLKGGSYVDGVSRRLCAVSFAPKLQFELLAPGKRSGLADVISVPAGFEVDRRQVERIGKVTVRTLHRAARSAWSDRPQWDHGCCE